MSERHERMKRIRRERRRKRRQEWSLVKTLKSISGWLVIAFTAMILGYGFVSFGFQNIYMVGPSMSPTIEDGEKLVVNQLAYTFGEPERYDIVAFRSVEHQDKYYTIKRVIGLPGETVLIQNGNVYINGNPLADSPIDDYIYTPGVAEDSITLGDGEYFLLGDNVNSSEDSRYPNVGNIKKTEIIGRIKVK